MTGFIISLSVYQIKIARLKKKKEFDVIKILRIIALLSL